MPTICSTVRCGLCEVSLFTLNPLQSKQLREIGALREEMNFTVQNLGTPHEFYILLLIRVRLPISLHFLSFVCFDIYEDNGKFFGGSFIYEYMNNIQDTDVYVSCYMHWLAASDRF